MTETSLPHVPPLFALHQEHVRPEWVDYNNHMNVAYYVLAFDHATDAVLDHLDLGSAYRRCSGCSVFVGEAHVTYDREVRAGEHLQVVSRISAFDAKRLVLFHEMFAQGREKRVASNEVLCVHVDLQTRRSSAWAKAGVEAIGSAVVAQQAVPPAAGSGRIVLPAKVR